MNSLAATGSQILVVDDEGLIVKVIEVMLHSNGFANTIPCDDPNAVLSLIEERSAELVLLDLTMPDISGEDILTLLGSTHPEIPVIVVTGLSDIDTAVRCMKLGAVDYISKPIDEPRLIMSVRNALRLHAIARENQALTMHMLADGLQHPEAFRSFTTCNPKLHTIFKYIEAIAPSAQPVFITGDTGTGKELVARAIHELSGLRGPFNAINVGGYDDTMFADMLFGHKKGAYTGAEGIRSGLISTTAGGTLFLDEIGDLTMQSQVKLLRLLQENEYYPIGMDTVQQSNVRIIAATNKNIDEAQRSGEFRKDLYYRLCTHRVHMPRLRERLDDLPLLVDKTLAESAQALGKKVPAYPKELIALLGMYEFPGNIRELKSMIHDAVSKHNGRIMSLSHFKEKIFTSGEPHAAAADNGGAIGGNGTNDERFFTMKEAERMHVEKALTHASNNQRLAAQLLGITRQALNQKLKKMHTMHANTV